MNEDKATRYHRLRRRAAAASAGLRAVWLLGLLGTGASVWLRDVAAGLVGGRPLVAVAVYAVLLALATEVLHLPLAWYRGIVIERRFGLSTERTARWWSDHARAGAVGLALGLPAVLALYALIVWWPDRWWLAATAGAAVALVVLAHAAPVVLLPLFYDCRPLDRPALAARLTALAARAGARVGGVFEWRLGDRTRKANAALMGLGRTRRILVSDTLLAEHSDAEVEVVVAHELGHHTHHDMWRGLVLEVARVAVAFFVADRALAALAVPLGLAGTADAAGLPVVLLALGVVWTALQPLAHAASRAHERRADRFALALTGNPEAFISAMRRLGDRNLAEPHPSRLTEVLFHTHPPVAARIAAARQWAASALPSTIR
jgi:STE24 endopeptidase